MSSNPEYTSYFFTMKAEDGTDKSIGFDADLTLLKATIDRKLSGNDEDQDIPKGDGEEEKIETTNVALGEEMGRALEIGLSQHHLIMISNIMGNMTANNMLNANIRNEFAKDEYLVEKTDRVSIYGLTEEKSFEASKLIERFRNMELGLAALPSAVLMSLVATFDSFTADVVRKMLRVRPERYADSERTMPVRDILRMESLEKFMDAVIDEEAYLFSRGSHEEQVKFIEKNFHIPIIKPWSKWPDFVEIFERRNLIAHGEKAYNARYVQICEKAGKSERVGRLGQPIELPLDYLDDCSDVLLEFSTLLVYVLWCKHFEPDIDKAHTALNEVSFQLISNRKPSVAQHILEFALSVKNAKIKERTKRMMIVNLASAFKQLKNQDKCAETLAGEDWTASSDNFKICVAALRDEVSDVIDMMEAVVGQGTVEKHSFRTWPVFSSTRKDDAFRVKFEAIFGEPLSEIRTQDAKASKVDGAEESADGSGDPKAAAGDEAGKADDGKTVH